MLDLINDTFKLTIDKIYFGKELTPEEVESETEYELLCTSDLSVNKRSNYGLEEPEVPPPISNDHSQEISPSTTESPKQTLKLSSEPDFNHLFPRGFYPSESMHSKLIEEQKLQHEKHNRERNEANLK